MGTGLVGIANNSGYGVYANNLGDNYALGVVSEGSGDGIFNSNYGGRVGLHNELFLNGTAIYTDLSSAGGTGEFINLSVQDGDGVLVNKVDNISLPSAGGDGLGFTAYVNTFTPSVGSVISGAAFAGDQYGVGHGMLINHYGTNGRAAEYNSLGTNNAEPALYAAKSGVGSTLYVENDSSGALAPFSVAEINYLGPDVVDHIGLSSRVAPAGSFGIGLEGEGGYYGIHGIHTLGGIGFAVYATGDMAASGTKTFAIDHPQDPANKILKHFSIESDEVLNMYRGTETFNEDGVAVVTMPSYYESVNKEASYQLTPIGASMPNLYIESELEGDTFTIAGGVAGKKVSWTVTAQRNDPYLQQFPYKREVEVDKGVRKGKYITPQLYGQPESKRMSYVAQKEKTAPSRISKEKHANMKKPEGRLLNDNVAKE